MNASTRRLQHQNVRAAAASPAGGADNRQPQQPLEPPKRERKEQLLRHSTSKVLEALTNDDSELARFLFVRSDDNGGPSSSWVDNARRNSLSQASKDEMPVMGTMDAVCYSLALEPMNIRNERIVMIFEAYAVFGALFLAGTWVVYEWGSRNGYGEDTDNGNDIVNRIFEFLMSLGIIFNIFLVDIGSFCWISSISFSASHEDYVFEMRKALKLCHVCLLATLYIVMLGLFFGIYQNLSPNWPETILALVTGAVLLFVIWNCITNSFVATVPLEVYHLPLWAKWMSFPNYMLTPSGRESIRTGAKVRANHLKERAYRERKRLDPDFDKSDNRTDDGKNGLRTLLRRAATSLGKVDLDISIYQERLEDDLFSEADQLKGRSVDFLARYMPWRLGEEVHRLLESK